MIGWQSACSEIVFHRESALLLRTDAESLNPLQLWEHERVQDETHQLCEDRNGEERHCDGTNSTICNVRSGVRINRHQETCPLHKSGFYVMRDLQAPFRIPECESPKAALVMKRNSDVITPDIASPAEYACDHWHEG